MERAEQYVHARKVGTLPTSMSDVDAGLVWVCHTCKEQNSVVQRAQGRRLSSVGEIDFRNQPDLGERTCKVCSRTHGQVPGERLMKLAKFGDEKGVDKLIDGPVGCGKNPFLPTPDDLNQIAPSDVDGSTATTCILLQYFTQVTTGSCTLKQ